MTGILWRNTAHGVQYAKAIHRKGRRLEVDWTANRAKAALVAYGDASAVIARAADNTGAPGYDAGAYGYTPEDGGR